jgi:hypothetical protein
MTAAETSPSLRPFRFGAEAIRFRARAGPGNHSTRAACGAGAFGNLDAPAAPKKINGGGPEHGRQSSRATRRRPLASAARPADLELAGVDGAVERRLAHVRVAFAVVDPDGRRSHLRGHGEPAAIRHHRDRGELRDYFAHT